MHTSRTKKTDRINESDISRHMHTSRTMILREINKKSISILDLQLL
jgi:hypothetical protein